MRTKIYKLVLIRGYTEAYHQLSRRGKKEVLGTSSQGRQGKSGREDGNAILRLPVVE